jgi:hypothetical protein
MIRGWGWKEEGKDRPDEGSGLAGMKPLSPDTPLEVEKIWLDGIRARGPLFQLQRTMELSDLCREAAKIAIARAMPDATEAERDERLLLGVGEG